MRALVVYNNYSGRSKSEKKLGFICNSLKSKYDIVECFKSTHPGSITEHLLVHAIEYNLVVAVGGDGTVHEAINGIAAQEKKPKLAYIPLGTCNDAARTLGLRKHLKATLKKILIGESTKIDIFKINSDYFAYGLAAGCFTEISYDVSHDVKKNMGKFAYYVQGLKSYKDTKTIRIVVDANQQRIEGEFSLFLALNTRYLAEFKIHRKKRIYLNDGLIRITLIKKTSKLRNIFDLGMFLLLGENYKKNIIHLDSSHFKIYSEAPVAYNTDGERYQKLSEIEVKVIPQSIDVILSKRVLSRHFLKKLYK